MHEEEKSGVERLKNKLYARGGDIKPPEERTPLSPNAHSTPTAWEDTTLPTERNSIEVPSTAPTFAGEKQHVSMAAKFLLGSVAFFVLAVFVAAAIFFGGGNTISPQNIDIQIVAPSIIDAGKEATFEIIIQNRNQADLELADLIIDYPEGTRSAQNPSQALSHERQSIGTVRSGEQIKRTISALVYGQEGVAQTIHTTLEYSVTGSNAVFQKQSETSFTVGSSPVSVVVTAPTEAITGEEFSIDVTIRSNSTTPITNLVLQGQYPFGFTLSESQPQAEAGGTLWRLGTVAPGSTKVIHLKGSIDGQDGDERVFRFLAGSNADQTDTQVKVPFIIMPETITIHRPFITGSIAIEGQSGKTASVSAGKTISGVVTWQNNLSDPVSNVELTLSFAGPALDTNSINGQSGFYQSANSSIIWSADKSSSLSSVAPGGKGTFSFTFATLPAGAGNVLINNPVIKLNLVVKATREAQGNVPETISSAASATVQLASVVSLSTQSLHYSGGFTNFGPMPPRAEQATSYTVVWVVKNSSNTVANTTVSATLPVYVQFLSAPAGSGITYDAASRTVRWSIGELKAGVGYTLPALQAPFQVTFLPSISQVGSTPSLSGVVVLSGQDRFAQVQVQTTADAPTIQLTNDPSAPGGMDIVAPK